MANTRFCAFRLRSRTWSNRRRMSVMTICVCTISNRRTGKRLAETSISSKKSVNINTLANYTNLLYNQPLYSYNNLRSYQYWTQRSMGLNIVLTGWDTCLQKEVNRNKCGVVYELRFDLRVIICDRCTRFGNTKPIRWGRECLQQELGAWLHGYLSNIPLPSVDLSRSNSIAIFYRATRTRARAAESQLTCAISMRQPWVFWGFEFKLKCLLGK